MQRISQLCLGLLSAANTSTSQVTDNTQQASSIDSQQAFYTMLLPYQPQPNDVLFVGDYARIFFPHDESVVFYQYQQGAWVWTTGGSAIPATSFM